MSDPMKTLYPIGLMDGRAARVEALTMPLHGPSAQYAVTLFEGIMGYPLDGGIGVVALKEHFRRLFESAASGDLGFERDLARVDALVAGAVDALPELFRTNGVRGPVYLRPTLYHGGTGDVRLGPALEGEIHLAMYLQRWEGHLAPKPEGQRALLSRHLKVPSPVAHLKCGANYGAAIAAKREARRRGFDEAIFRDHRGRVAEATSQNLLIAERGRVVTPAASSDGEGHAPILPGITLRILRETVAPDLGLAFVESALTFDALLEKSCEGIALCGTASEVRRVGSLEPDPYLVRASQVSVRGRSYPPSEALQALADGYARLTRGEAYREWLTVIPS
jgi:branched-chain amino acid aminotransferase